MKGYPHLSTDGMVAGDRREDCMYRLTDCTRGTAGKVTIPVDTFYYWEEEERLPVPVGSLYLIHENVLHVSLVQESGCL